MHSNENSSQRYENNDYTPGRRTTVALGLLLAFGLVVQREKILTLLPVVRGITQGNIEEVESTLVHEWIAEHPQEIETWRKLSAEDLVRIQQETRDPRKHAALNGAILEAMERGAEREYLLKQKSQ